MNTILPLGIAILVLGGASAAQSSQFGGLLVGNTGPSGILSSLAGKVYTQDVATCSTPVLRGSTLRMATKGAGGTAYDAARQAVWISDGKTVALYDMVAKKTTCSFNARLNANFLSGEAEVWNFKRVAPACSTERHVCV